MLLPPDPSVLVLLVATDGARWLPEVLRGLRAQKHRPIKVLAIDNASSDGSGELLARAFGPTRVVTLDRRVGYGRALAAGLKVAAERDLVCDAFLLLHDDAALRPGAIQAMVHTMREREAGIVGAKLLEWDEETVLQDVGQTTDRYGRVVPMVERGELDQGQHDGVHEVMYAQSAAFLIAREVVETVGLFDLRYVTLRDDLDLCWRARIAGYRTVVTTDASARHVAAGFRELRAAPPSGRLRYFGERNLIATLVKNYSLPRLALALPVTVAISVGHVLLYLVTGRRRSALQVLEALQWNVVHLPSTLRARLRAQHSRRVGDEAVARLMHRGATRLRAQVERALEKVVGEEIEPDEDEDLQRPPPSLAQRIRAHPALFTWLAALAVVAVGARTLLGSGALAGADLAPFPERWSEFLTEYAAGWRGAGRGGAAPATPGLLVLGLVQLICAGSAWLAQRALLVGLPVIGALGMLRVARAFDMRGWSRRLPAVCYALTPVVLTAYGIGRVADLVLAAAAPWLLVPLLRAAGVPGEAGWRSVAAGTVGLAVAASLAPVAIPFVIVAGIVLSVAAGAYRKATWGRVLRAAVLMSAGALVLLFPWSPELFRQGSALGASGGSGRRMVELLGLAPGPLSPIGTVLRYGVPIAALGGLMAARPNRRRAASSLAALAVIGLLIAWGVARGTPWLGPRASIPLFGVAVALCALVGFGLEGVAERLRTTAFGVRHIATGIAGILLVGQLGAAAAWIASGSRPGITESGSLALSFFESEERERGAFRILWAAGTRSSPVVALTDPRGNTMLSYLARTEGAGARALSTVVRAIASGSTEAAGRMLATFGVRYVIVRPEADHGLRDAFARQVDLGFTQRFLDATIYENEVALPVAATVDQPAWVAAAGGTLESVVQAPPAASPGPGLSRPRPGTYEGRAGRGARPSRGARTRAPAPAPDRRLLLAEDFSSDWVARSGARSYAPAESFGWATQFRVDPLEQAIRIEWRGQRWHRLALLVQVLLLVSFAVWWSQRAARERGER